MSYSIIQLKQLIKTNPTEFTQIINNHISEASLLSAAVELLDEISDESLTVPLLKRFLKHVHAAVRESALMATSSIFMDKKPPADIFDRVKVIAKSDPAVQVRECAADLLKDFEK